MIFLGAMEAEPSMFKSVGIFRGLEYLESLLKPDGRTPVILEWLAEDIHSCKEVIAKQLGKMKNFRGITMSVLGMMIKGDKRLDVCLVISFFKGIPHFKFMLCKISKGKVAHNVETM